MSQTKRCRTSTSDDSPPQLIQARVLFLGEDPPAANASKKAPKKSAKEKAAVQKFQLKTPKVCCPPPQTRCKPTRHGHPTFSYKRYINP